MQSAKFAKMKGLKRFSVIPLLHHSITKNEDWSEIAHGVIISLEQVENYPKESGREDDPAKEWRNRGKSIAEAEDKE